MVLALGHWLAAFAEANGGEAAAQPVTEFAARSLDRAWKRVRKGGRHLSRLSSEELHALRIEIKRLRYAVEFFAALYDSREVRGFLSGLKGMQDFLGHMNDLDVARHLMDALVAERRFSGRSYVRGDADMARAEGLVIGWHAAGLARDRRHLADLWSRVLAQDPFWR
jgi:CHAD domain-containing protein